MIAGKGGGVLRYVLLFCEDSTQRYQRWCVYFFHRLVQIFYSILLLIVAEIIASLQRVFVDNG